MVIRYGRSWEENVNRSKTWEVTLDATGIDSASAEVAAFFDASAPDRRTSLSARIAMESVLIRLSEHFGSETVATLRESHYLGQARLLVQVRGKKYDPREHGEESDWESMLLISSGLKPWYAYIGGVNVVMLEFPRAPLGSIARMIRSFVLGAIVAALGMNLPTETRQHLLTALINPLFDTYVGMLAGIAGPLVFLSVVWGICGIGDLEEFHRSGRALITRFMGTDFLALLLALATCIPFFPFHGPSGSGEGFLDDSITTLLNILPTNLLSPFIEGNTLQIIVLAVVVGICILVLGESTDMIRKLVNQAYSLIRLLMRLLCNFLPAFVFVMVLSQAWSGTLDLIATSWQPLVAMCCVSFTFLFLNLAFTSIRSHRPMNELIDACLPAFTLALTTASSSASFSTMLATLEEKLGIRHEQASFGVPLGIVLCKPSTAILLVVLMLFSAQAYGLGASPLWYLQLAISCFLYTVAVPPVPGGMLACYGMLFHELGIPLEALAVVTALDIILDYPCTACDVTNNIINVFDSTRGNASHKGIAHAHATR